jgi:hypothetical protein
VALREALEILSGRRYHWNTIIGPLLRRLGELSESGSDLPTRALTEIGTAAYAAFHADFVRPDGEFGSYLRKLGAGDAAYVLRAYLAHMVAYFSFMKVWSEVGISEDSVWQAADAFLPGSSRYRERFERWVNPDDKGRDILRMYRSVLELLEHRGIAAPWDPTNESSPQPPYDVVRLSVLHPTLLNTVYKRMLPELRDLAAGR